MKIAIAVIRSDNLVYVAGQAKRLPVMQLCAHAFHALHWNGDTGLIEYEGEPNLHFDDFELARPFLELWEDEPPQLHPFDIGAAPAYRETDAVWAAVIARHTTPIDLDTPIAQLRAGAVAEQQSLEDKQREREAAWQAQQVELRRQREQEALERRAARLAAGGDAA